MLAGCSSPKFCCEGRWRGFAAIVVVLSTAAVYRAEEAAVIARQKEAEAAGTAARLPSTLHPDSKAPLAKVNGENDAAGGSGSSSVIQYVWNNVLSLATGVGGRSSGGGAAGLPPATPVAGAGVMEAAATRRKALELIEVGALGSGVGCMRFTRLVSGRLLQLCSACDDQIHILLRHVGEQSWQGV
jgi:hypothetical protein